MSEDAQQRHILLLGLEDDEFVELAPILHENGFAATCTQDVAVALDEFDRTRPGTVVLPSLLNQIDAERLARMLRRAVPGLSLVIAYAHPLEEMYFRESLPAPIAFVERPVDGNAVVAAVKETLRTPTAGFSVVHSQAAASAPLAGDLHEKPFAELMIELLEVNATGVLRIENQAVRKSIYFYNGEPTYADSNLLTENLGRFLIDRGTITQEQFDKAREIQLSEGIKQGEALVKIGVVSHAELFELLRLQIREKIVNCFGLDSASYAFETTRDFLTEKLRFELNPLDIVIEGIQRFQDGDLPKLRLSKAEDLFIAASDLEAPCWKHARSALPAGFAEWTATPCSLSELRDYTSWSPERLSAVVTAV
ncbi:MAG: DUF4388 domain-containing protein, partial [Myxococcales bacterium]|nr:DUF4388 domain-containing protein [Myxococcales bacterium]